ncbi:eukaryotic aspartyl protease domain-containing protein [Ditylenchus destructor]|nr:eukaryotic aspartyl protease domain-containing protein [Ditylenchus destructor]
MLPFKICAEKEEQSQFFVNSMVFQKIRSFFITLATRSVGYEETAQLTLGGEDTDNCQSKYTYVPQIRSRYGLSGFRVHLASGSIDGMPDFVKGLNTTLKVSPDLGRMYLNDDFFYLLTNASNASWNETINEWEVDCNVTKAKNITLNIGSDGNTADGNTKQLVLTGADYIQYDSRKNTCIVYASRYKYVASVTMTNRFLNNHCIAYNAKEKTIGFADAK